jgi:hypothetical protein
MGIELGIDRRQIEAVKGVYRRWTTDPVQFRFLATLLIMVGIVVLVEMPFAARLDKARKRHKEARALSALAHDVRGFVEQVEAVDPKVAVSAELVEWQNHVLTLLAHSSATLISLEPKSVEARGPFQVVQMELVARGTSYREFVDFMDRLEHGERLMRVEKLRLEKHQTTMYMTCIIRGLVKTSAGKGAGKGDDADKRKGTHEGDGADDGDSADRADSEAGGAKGAKGAKGEAGDKRAGDAAKEEAPR